MGSLTPGAQAHLDRLTERARAVIARVPPVPTARPVQTEPMWRSVRSAGRTACG